MSLLNRTVHVRNVSQTHHNHDILVEYFERVGDVDHCFFKEVEQDPSEEMTRDAYVVFASEKDCSRCVHDFDGRKLKSIPLKITLLDPLLLQEVEILLNPAGSSAEQEIDSVLKSLSKLNPDLLNTIITRLSQLVPGSPGLPPKPAPSISPSPIPHVNPPTSQYPIVTQMPRLSNFSGDISSKGDISFHRWKYEVQSMLFEHQSNSITLNAIRRSLKGTAADVVSYMPTDSTPMAILAKLGGLFDDVLSGEDLMQKFYNETQKVDESVAVWGCRLEALLSRAIEGGKVSPLSKDEMLRSKFWSDLHDERLKSATRHNVERHTNFADLCVAVRKTEQEISEDDRRRKRSGKAQHNVNSVISSTDNSDKTDNSANMLKEVKQELKHLTEQLNQLSQSMLQMQTEHKQTQSKKIKGPLICYKCGIEGHTANRCQSQTRISQDQVIEIKRKQNLN